MYAPPSNLFEPMPTFIETQFPIARLSAESYKERKANNGQTLTRLGKWWGRKPLVLVRASILGMLMPASADAKRDREIFLKILTMDDEGTWLRCKDHSASVPWRTAQGPSRAVFDALPYAERISYCDRPENVEGPSEEAWSDINAHLGTTGTVCLVLRKRAANEPGFLDEVYPLVEDEVKRQIASMQALDEGGEPNFNDADYQLAAYAAALKVLTHYGTLDGKDVEHEVFAVYETAAADNSPEPGRQYLRDTFGQGYWGKREGFIGLLEWLAALGNAQGMEEWLADSEAARILAGRLRNDHA